MIGGYGGNDENDPPEKFGPPRPTFVEMAHCLACRGLVRFTPPRMFVAATIRAEKCVFCGSDRIALCAIQEEYSGGI